MAEAPGTQFLRRPVILDYRFLFGDTSGPENRSCSNLFSGPVCTFAIPLALDMGMEKIVGTNNYPTSGCFQVSKRERRFLVNSSVIVRDIETGYCGPGKLARLRTLLILTERDVFPVQRLEVFKLIFCLNQFC